MAKGQPVSLALQGGGAHGAFGWGVLDYLLEEGSLDVSAISATSAGAMNAVAYAYGRMTGGLDGGRALMEEFWRRVSRAGGIFNPASGNPFTSWFQSFYGKSTSGFAFLDALARMTSPYDVNPFNLHPLRGILDDLIDFDLLHTCKDVQLHIAATNVSTGRIRIFGTGEVTRDAVLASACLPFIFQAVEVEGEHFWDGGYTGNPALFPLIYSDAPRDFVIVHINPIERPGPPRTADEIMDRVNEITFNASLLSEIRAINFVQKLLSENWLADRFKGNLRNINLHSIRADNAMRDYSVSTKFQTDWDFLTELRDKGRETAKSWLERCGKDVGKRSSIDAEAEFLAVKAAE